MSLRNQADAEGETRTARRDTTASGTGFYQAVPGSYARLNRLAGEQMSVAVFASVVCRTLPVGSGTMVTASSVHLVPDSFRGSIL